MDCSREKFSVLGLLIWYGISGVECLDCYACVSKVWGTSAKAPALKYGETVKEHKHKEFQIRVKLSYQFQHDFFYSPWMVTRGVRTL